MFMHDYINMIESLKYYNYSLCSFHPVNSTIIIHTVSRNPTIHNLFTMTWYYILK